MMIVEVNTPPIADLEKITDYPFLGLSRHDGVIVFFTAPSEGTVVVPRAWCRIGHTSEHWDMSGFVPFDGKVTLYNKPPAQPHF